ncbi:SpoIIIAC/SpoIIIAD family protein [Bengtsoniella intestinalis]|uniref:SpoIIIAC/SpoIIIAD family protein n=2 Tax=Bengtsoniella intestinalis TaxID=3073143 RepID=UPI00391F4265
MEMVFEITVGCLVTALLALVVAKSAPEMALVLMLGCTVVVMVYLAQVMGQVVGFFQTLANYGGLSEGLLEPLLKSMGIAVVVKVGSSLCRDANASALGAVVELSGTVCALSVALPLVETVLGKLVELMG